MLRNRPLRTDLAAAVQEEQAATRRVVIVHPGTLPVSVYRPLAELLAPAEVDIADLTADRAYAHAGLDPRVPDPTLGQLADATVARASMAERQTDLLIGWSFGGLVALAAAARLTPRPQVILLDTVAPSDNVDAARADVPRWFADYLSWRAGRRIVIDPDRAPRDLDQLHGAALAAGALAPDVTTGGFRMLTRAYLAGLERNFRVAAAGPAPTPSAITLIKPARGLLVDSSANGWEAFTEHTRVVPCAGDHYSMLTDRDALARIAAEVTRVAEPRSH